MGFSIISIAFLQNITICDIEISFHFKCEKNKKFLKFFMRNSRCCFDSPGGSFRSVMCK